MKTLVGAAEPEEPPPLAPQVTLTSNSTTTSTILIWRREMGFVCEPCKTGNHTTCKPGQCDCQHKGQ